MAKVTESESVARKVRRRVLASSDRFWRISDFSEASRATTDELRRLVAQGELTRVRRGLYWRGHQTRFGLRPADRSDAVDAIVKRRDAVGPAGWNATNLLGLSSQVPAAEILAMSHRPPEGLDGIRWVDRRHRTARRTARLNGLEVALLETLDGWERYVEVDADDALQRLVRVVGDERVRVDRLVRASRTEPARVRERLRAVLRGAGLNEAADEIEPARDARTRARARQVLPSA
jgi:hypothetical protein